MAQAKRKSAQTLSSNPSSGLKWLLLELALIAAIIAIIYFFRDDVAQAAFETFGFGIFIIVLWIGALVWVILRNKSGEVVKFWNSWLGAMVFSAAAFGIMSLFAPNFSFAGVQMGGEDGATLAGDAGEAVAGNSFTWARLAGMVFASVILFAPRKSINATQQVSSSTWEWTKPVVISFLVEFSSMVRQAFLWLLDLIPLLLIKFVAWLREEKTESKPRPASKVESEVSEEIHSEMAEKSRRKSIKPEQMTLPGIDRQLPPIELLDEASKAKFAQSDDDERARLIEEALGSYGVEVKVKQINPGPSVTQFGVEPGWTRKYKKVIEKDQDGRTAVDKDGNPKYHMEEISRTRVKVEKITALANDLALALAVSDIRIEAPMPGKAMVGIEVPNTSSSIVSLRGVLESSAFKKAAGKSKLATALGLGPGGEPVAGDIARMPHLLIAGATGSGKSVCLNCIVGCVLTQTSPQDVRLVLIDPKRVEMVNFADIPHLITPVVVDADKAVETLRRVAMEMDNRYHKFASVGARNIESYNRHPKVTEPLPYFVVIIDELADLMMTSADVVEPIICRIAQLARATGIHLVVATQRPSVDVITGLIKANFPTRISFAVVSSIDSRTILDTIGAEKLLGKGDMLYVPPEASKPKRIRGCFISDEEIERLVGWWKEWAVRHFPQEVDTAAQEFASLSVTTEEVDPFLEKAREICAESGKVSASLLQRKLHIGYQRAARLMEQLEGEGLFDDKETASSWEGEL
ncbi:MAG: DNA translocase FtsK [Dehalococcoidia bacterium]